MSSATPKKEWLVLVPDYPECLEKRLGARSDHLSNTKPKVGSSVLFGGATLKEQVKEGDQGPPKMDGSLLLLACDTEEEVWEMLRSDPYVKAGVWDVEKAKIWPFKTAFRVAA